MATKKVSAAERKAYTSVDTEASEPNGEQRRVCTAPVQQAPPEAQHLSWEDPFFDGDSEVIAVFDFDYATMEDFYVSTGWAYLAGTLIYPPVFAASLVGLAPCFLRKNVQWSVNAQHVAVTRDGIRFVRDRRRTCWGLPCTDAGRSSKTVPFDKITDCDIEEPAGATCICIKNVLSTVNIDTASSGGPQHELRISGLRDPHSFKKLVWGMKRLNAHQIAASSGSALQSAAAAVAVPPIASSIVRDAGGGAASGGGDGSDAGSIALLLREIRDELRELRREGRGGAESAAAAALSAVGGDGLEDVQRKSGEVELPSSSE